MALNRCAHPDKIPRCPWDPLRLTQRTHKLFDGLSGRTVETRQDVFVVRFVEGKPFRLRLQASACLVLRVAFSEIERETKRRTFILGD